MTDTHDGFRFSIPAKLEGLGLMQLSFIERQTMDRSPEIGEVPLGCERPPKLQCRSASESGIRLPPFQAHSHNTSCAEEGESLFGLVLVVASSKDDPPMASDELLTLLVCPLGKAPLRREHDILICTQCGLRFGIKDSIPNMLVEEADLPPDCLSLSELKCVKLGQGTVDPA
jgi:hypothetical protein